MLEIIQRIGLKDVVQIRGIKRLGLVSEKGEQGSKNSFNRPILVTVDDKEMRDLILINSKKCSDVDVHCTKYV